MVDQNIRVGGSYQFGQHQDRPVVTFFTKVEIPSEWDDIDLDQLEEELKPVLELFSYYLWDAVDDIFNHDSMSFQEPVKVKSRFTELTGMLAGFCQRLKSH